MTPAACSVTAASAGRPPAALFDQLAPGGTLVAPVELGPEQVLMRYRDGAGEAIAPVRFVPLVPGGEEPRGA